MSVKENLRAYLLARQISADELARLSRCAVERLRREVFGKVRLSGELYFAVCRGLALPLCTFVDDSPAPLRPHSRQRKKLEG